MSKEILQKNNPTLRQKCSEVLPEEFSTEKLKKELDEMKSSLNSTPDGVALAAPQIGLSKCIFIVSERIFEEGAGEATELIYINPKIIKKSTKKTIFDEGCLSVRNIYGKIKRSSNVTIEAQDLEGKTFTRGAGGLLAEIFQHETDHLKGVLFIDNAYDLKEMEHDGSK